MKRLFSLEESNVEYGRIEVDELEYENLNNKGNISWNNKVTKYVEKDQNVYKFLFRKVIK
jgi:hypothetical protein